MSKQNEFEISFFESVLKKDPKHVEVIELLGGLYTNAGRIDDGLKMDRRLARLCPENPVVHYNLACSLAIKRRNKDALDALNKAVELGYNDIQWLVEDPDLENLRNYPAFQRLIRRLRSILRDPR